MTIECDLVPRNSTRAIHFERINERDGLYTIACGKALPPDGNMGINRTRDPERVTCRVCWHIAHPPM